MNNSNEQQETLEPCRFCGKEAKGFWDGPYLHVSGPPDGLHFYSIVCNGCCSTASYESKERAIEKWNARRASVAAPEGISWTALLSVLERLRSKNKNPEADWYNGWNAAIQCLINDINSHAAASSPLPAEPPPKDDAHRCPHCGRRMVGDFDEDVGIWYECANCDYREQVSSAPAEPLQQEGEQKQIMDKEISAERRNQLWEQAQINGRTDDDLYARLLEQEEESAPVVATPLWSIGVDGAYSCPFCGAPYPHITDGLDEDGRWCVMCFHCKAGTAFCVERARAIELWNTRAFFAAAASPETPVGGEQERALQMLTNIEQREVLKRDTMNASVMLAEWERDFLCGTIRQSWEKSK